MQTNKYLTLLREIKSVSFATVSEAGLPEVRIADVMIVLDNKIYFVTARGKDFGQQLEKQPYVAVSGMTKDYQMIKLKGPVKRLGREWVDRIIAENPMVGDIYPGKTREILEAYCLYEGKGSFFDLSTHPVHTIPFGVGESPASFIRPQIDNSCIQCGLCQEYCPTSCIQPGTPYHIDVSTCMNCGACLEKCPVQAIKKQEIIYD